MTPSHLKGPTLRCDGTDTNRRIKCVYVCVFRVVFVCSCVCIQTSVRVCKEDEKTKICKVKDLRFMVQRLCVMMYPDGVLHRRFYVSLPTAKVYRVKKENFLKNLRLEFNFNRST